MATYRVTMSFLMEADSKEELVAEVTGELGERLEFLSALEQGGTKSEKKSESRWLRAVVKQLTGK